MSGGRVTGVEPQARHPDRTNLYIDDHFALGLSAYVAAGIRVGQELTSEQLGELARAEQVEKGRELALNRIETRPRSEQEIRRYLASKDLPKAIVDEVIARLREAGLLGDQDFARFWVENREGFKPRSARALKFELRQKGVPDQEIARAIRNLDERESAYRAALPRAERWKQLEPAEFREKLSGFLARRGFDYQITRETVTRILNELTGQAGEENTEPPPDHW